MYSYLIDTRTNTWYMEPNKTLFRIYSDEDEYTGKEIKPGDRAHIRLVGTDIDDKKEMETMLYNAGFFSGMLDDEPLRLDKNDIYYYDRNPNEISFAQYMLTRDKRYLTYIKKNLLFTLCRIAVNPDTGLSGIFFPTVSLDSGDSAILAYTSHRRMSQELFDKYPGWKKVRMTWDVKCIVNDKFIIT